MSDDPRPVDPVVLTPADVLFGGMERADRQAAYKAQFWALVDRLADFYGVQRVLSGRKTAARWDDTRDPPRLLEANVRLRDPMAPARKRRRQRP